MAFDVGHTGSCRLHKRRFELSAMSVVRRVEAEKRYVHQRSRSTALFRLDRSRKSAAPAAPGMNLVHF